MGGRAGRTRRGEMRRTRRRSLSPPCTSPAGCFFRSSDRANGHRVQNVKRWRPDLSAVFPPACGRPEPGSRLLHRPPSSSPSSSTLPAGGSCGRAESAPAPVDDYGSRVPPVIPVAFRSWLKRSVCTCTSKVPATARSPPYSYTCCHANLPFKRRPDEGGCALL